MAGIIVLFDSSAQIVRLAAVESISGIASVDVDPNFHHDRRLRVGSDKPIATPDTRKARRGQAPRGLFGTIYCEWLPGQGSNLQPSG